MYGQYRAGGKQCVHCREVVGVCPLLEVPQTCIAMLSFQGLILRLQERHGLLERVSVIIPGLYFSAESSPLLPSNPPTAYSSPLRTPTPRVLRRDNMGSTGTQHTLFRSSCSTDLGGKGGRREGGRRDGGKGGGREGGREGGKGGRREGGRREGGKGGGGREGGREGGRSVL